MLSLIFIFPNDMPVNFVMVGRTDPSNSDNLNGDGGGWASACARVCVRDVSAIYDNNI